MRVIIWESIKPVMLAFQFEFTSTVDQSFYGSWILQLLACMVLKPYLLLNIEKPIVKTLQVNFPLNSIICIVHLLKIYDLLCFLQPLGLADVIRNRLLLNILDRSIVSSSTPLYLVLKWEVVKILYGCQWRYLYFLELCIAHNHVPPM